MPARGKTVRVEFTKNHDIFLTKYLAKYCPTKEGRSGRLIYDRLVANARNKWPWSVHHTSQSWRERYVKHSEQFDVMILRQQLKHNDTSMDKRKRPAEPMPIETLAPSTKRIKLGEEESPSSSDTGKPTRHESESASKSASASNSKQPPEPPETPPRAPHPAQESEPTSARPIVPAPSPLRSSTSTTRKPTSDHSSPQTRRDTLNILSGPDQQLPLTDGIPEARSTPRHVKYIKARPGTPSDMFASEPSSPKMDAAVPALSVQGPSPQSQLAPSTPNGSANGTPATPVLPRALPRVVDSFHGRVLVDRDGHIPRALPSGEQDGAEEEDNEARWPPARDHATKQRPTSRPDVEVDAHHPFSQPQSQPRPDQVRLYPPSEHVSQVLDGPLLRRTVAARFSGQVRHAVQPQVESELRKDETRNGMTPLKLVVAAAPPADPFSCQIQKHPPKVFKLPAPRASTRSPFWLEETRHPESPPRRPSPSKRARRPELIRTRRQTIGHGHENRNGRERERRREVPSIDLVALSRSSASARSSSHSSADTSVSARPSRWSLPAFVHATPWLLDERAAPSPAYGNLGGDTCVRTSSTPRFVYTPSPVRSIAGTSAPASLASGIPGPSSLSLVPHPPDHQLAALHGLASLLAYMSVNHGLALSVVEAVYKRVGSLREADEVLKGMREAAEGFGEQEIERVRERRGGVVHGRRKNGQGLRGDKRKEERSGSGASRLRFMVASEDGEGSEYTPPETSRAALWMRQSELTSYIEEKDMEEDEEAAEGREVEEELWGRDEDEDEGEEAHNDFSRYAPMAEGNSRVVSQDADEDDGTQNTGRPERLTNVLLEDTRLAKRPERKLGKQQFRRNVAMAFTNLSRT